jgi:hypothetical protein
VSERAAPNLATAWAELDAANATLGWTVGRPSLHDDLRGAERWEQWPFDAGQEPKAGKRSREWMAVGLVKVDCVREMARCLRDSCAWTAAPR